MENDCRITFLLGAGYSMPASDEFMTAMLQAAMAGRSASSKPLKVFVVDPCHEVRDHYARLFAPLGTNLNFEGHALEDWILGDLSQLIALMKEALCQWAEAPPGKAGAEGKKKPPN